ncbi:MAG TPA: hypothetical protein VME68_11120 [Acidobacteriaceae bacterium]|nr:hypothetical protein [Acidobacteriaceae bacterium]
MPAWVSIGKGKKPGNPRMVAVNLRLMIFLWAVIFFNLGNTASVIARETARHDPNHLKNLEMLTLLVGSAAVFAIGLSIHISIQRLLRAADSE